MKNCPVCNELNGKLGDNFLLYMYFDMMRGWKVLHKTYHADAMCDLICGLVLVIKCVKGCEQKL